MDGAVSSDGGQVLRAVKSRIATALVGHEMVEPRIGKIALRPHQVEAIARLHEILGLHRGALLADAVGLGKTYVALGVARTYARPAVVCPAALRPMWARALETASLSAPVITTEALSRGVQPVQEPDLIIIDEAHHFRTPGTRRYEAVAHLARRARVLLLSATPLQNSRRDIVALLSIFAGTAVERWTDAALSRLIVRRNAEGADQHLPTIRGPIALSPGGDDDCLDAILALPPAVPAADEGVARALATMSLLHLWASSRAALLASIRRRQARAIALRDAISTGHLPTTTELSAWHYADESLQLAFPLFDPGVPPSVDTDALRAQLDRFIEGASRIIAVCRNGTDPDASRADLMRSLRARHPGARCVAFSQYAETVTGLGRLLRADRGLALVTAAGGRIASGSVTREEVLAQFALNPAPVPEAERIDLLVATDLLSEGIDLRGASVIIHLDLPWNPARLEQREGRARRMGSRFETIHVYTFVPPTAAERILALERRLTEKLRVTKSLLGSTFKPFGVGPGDCAESRVATAETLRELTRSWIDPSCRLDGSTITATRSTCDGWIAVIVIESVTMMIGNLGNGVTDDPASFVEIVRGLDEEIPVSAERRDRALAEIHNWVGARRASTGVGDQSAAKRAIFDRLTQTVARAPRHRWPRIVATAQRTRDALPRVRGIATERVLATLARSPAEDEAWLQSVDAFCQLHAADRVPRLTRDTDAVIGVILLVSLSAAGATPE